MKDIKMLVPSFVNDFKCIGAECEDNCCGGWIIHVDKDTYKKYRSLSDKSSRDLLEKHVNRNRKSLGDYDYAKIRLDKDGRCPLMLSDGLCLIHKNLSEDLLCPTCKIYPRSYNVVNDMIEKSLAISCPEAARIVLMNPDGIEFYIDENTDNLSYQYVSRKNIDLSKSKKVFSKCFWELRTFTIELLQNRNFSIEDRLVILGMFINKVHKLNKYEDIISLAQQYQMNIENGAFDGATNDLKYDHNLSLDFAAYVTQTVLSVKDNSAKYVDVVNKTIQGLKLSDDKINSLQLYKSANNNQYKNFKNKHEYVLENYLVTDVYKSLFPIDQKDLMEYYVELIIKFSMVKLNLIGLSQYNNQELTIEDSISIIYSLSRYVDHNPILISSVIEHLEKNNIKTLAHMIILIGQ